jgi:2-methylcitrate dehydratase PrpD
MAAPPFVAALVHGTAGCWEELDSGSVLGGHPALHVLPAALAVAQANKLPGEQLLTAFTVGYEIVSRLFAQVQIQMPVHPHGHVGAIGAAVAVDLLLGGDRVREAAEIAAALPTITTWDLCFAGSTARNMSVGMASAAGITSSYAARAGLRATEESFNALSRGIVSSPRPDAPAAPDPRDAGWAVESTYFKFDGACWLAQSAVQAGLGIGQLRADEIAEVEVRVAERSGLLLREPVETPLSQRFSVPYLVSVALLRGRTLTADTEIDDEARTLMSKVRATTDAELVVREPAAFPARVTVTTTDGRRRTAEIEVPEGHPRSGVREDRIRDKFLDLVQTDDPAALYDALLGIDAHPDVSRLFSGPSD